MTMKNANRQMIIDVLMHGGYISHEQIYDHIQLHDADGNQIASMMHLQLDKLTNEGTVTGKTEPWSYYTVYRLNK